MSHLVYRERPSETQFPNYKMTNPGEMNRNHLTQCPLKAPSLQWLVGWLDAIYFLAPLSALSPHAFPKNGQQPPLKICELLSFVTIGTKGRPPQGMTCGLLGAENDQEPKDSGRDFDLPCSPQLPKKNLDRGTTPGGDLSPQQLYYIM